MLILGLDPSQKTGWALYDTQAALTAVKAGVIKAGDWEKGQFEEMAGSIGRALKDLIKEIGKPDFAVVEKAPRQPAGSYGGNKRKPSAVKFMGEEMPAQEVDSDEGGGGLQSTRITRFEGTGAWAGDWPCNPGDTLCLAFQDSTRLRC